KSFKVFCTKKPATIPIVVGNDAAHTPSRFKYFRIEALKIYVMQGICCSLYFTLACLMWLKK
ncbi:hypothetical protein ALC53_01873, partial [Atta colombica]